MINFAEKYRILLHRIFQLRRRQLRAELERPEPSIPRSLGHHREWIHAIKTGGATTCNFDYAGPLTEVVLLGNIAHRTSAALKWNHGKMKLTGHPEAAELMQHIYRAGWQL